MRVTESERRKNETKMLNFKMTNSKVERCDSLHLQPAENKNPVKSLRIKLYDFLCDE